MRHKRSRNVTIGACVLAGALAIALIVRAAFATDVAPPTITEQGGYTTFTYTVTPGTGEAIKDFHLERAADPPAIEGTPLDPDGQGPWTASKNSSGCAHWKTSGAAMAGPMSFSIKVKTSKHSKRPGKWYATSDGKEPGTGNVVDAGPVTPPDGTDAPIDVPVPLALVAGGNTIPTGNATGLPIDSSEAGMPYVLYAVETVTGAPNPWDDPAGFADWATAHPIPVEWNLTFVGMSGTTDEDGDTNAPRIMVPNDPTLVGRKFFLVAIVDSEEPNEGPAKITDWPAKEMTIVAD